MKLREINLPSQLMPTGIILLLSAIWLGFFSSPVYAMKLIYSDMGCSASAFTWHGVGGSFDGNYGDESTPEGTKCWKTVSANYAGWGVFYTVGPQNWSAYADGVIRFWIKSNNTVKIEIEAPQGTKGTKYVQSTGGAWEEKIIPISEFTGIDLSYVHGAFLATIETSGTFYIDHVRWQFPGEVTSWSAEIHNRSNNQTTTAITWASSIGTSPGQIQAGSGTWKTADQYVLLHTTVTYPNWGIQIYTDNKSADANPAYTGNASNWFNLVGVDNTANKLDMCWKVTDDTFTYTPGQPIERPDYSGFTDYCWKRMKDVQQSTDTFHNDEFCVRVVSNKGMYWHESQTEPGNPGYFTSPVAIYFGACFRNSLAQEYRTNRLFLELYRL